VLFGEAMIPEKVRMVLEAHNLEAIEFEEGSTSTARAAAEKLGVMVGQIAKSLLFIGKNKQFYLVLCPGDRKISSSKLKSVLGVKSRMANAEETFQATGFHLGGVCPFGIEEIDIFIDESLNRYDRVYPAAGNSASGVPMTFIQLLEITGGILCDCTEPIGTNG
jgi:prolyl-tRNA editing enzyme YbaK/EbsC (Cys-tRNA(Pro) deacylase)